MGAGRRFTISDLRLCVTVLLIALMCGEPLEMAQPMQCTIDLCVFGCSLCQYSGSSAHATLDVQDRAASVLARIVTPVAVTMRRPKQVTTREAPR